MLMIKRTNTYSRNPILALSPTAYYQYGVGVTSAGGFASMWADQADTDNGLVLPGVAANYASAPDSVPLSIAGDIEIIVKLALDDWTPAAVQEVASKWDANNQAYFFRIGTDGKIYLFTSSDGTNTSTTSASTAATGVADGATKWIRATLDVDNGAGGKTAKFYLSDDGTTWTQLGADVTSAGTTTIYDGTSLLRIGVKTAAAGYVNGRIYRTIIKDGIDGTTVFDADFSAQPKGTTSFAESSSNGATVTVNASGALPAHIGSQKDLLQGTGTNQPAYSAGVLTFDGVDNYMKTGAIVIAQPFMSIMLFKQVTWTSGDVIHSGGTADYGALYQSATTPRVRLYSITGPSTENADLAVGAYGVVTSEFSGATSYTKVNLGSEVGGAIGLGGLAAFTLGANNGTTNWSNIAVMECVLFSTIPSDGVRDQVISYLMAKGGV